MTVRPCRHPGCPRVVRERGKTYCEYHLERVKRPCRNPRCPNVVKIGEQYCPDCEKAEEKRYDEQRGSARQRGYDRAWEKLRNAYLQRHPLCERCERRGHVVPAEIIHHRIPITEGGARLDEANLEALCKTCHEREHGRWWRR